jgi:hypothetical protein
MAVLIHFYLEGTQGENSVILDVSTFKSFSDLQHGIAGAFSIARPECERPENSKMIQAECELT